MTLARVVLARLSAAMNGGFMAIADVSQAMASAGAEDDYRLIGGVSVMLHIHRLGLDLPLWARVTLTSVSHHTCFVGPNSSRRSSASATARSSATDGSGNSMNVASPPLTCSCLPTAPGLATR